MSNNDEKLWTYYQKENPEVFSLTHNRHNQVFKQIKNHIKPQSRLLEVGFGDGYLLRKLSQQYVCWGADIDNEIIEKAKANVKDVKLVTISIDGPLPFENDFFDSIVASEVLEHMSDRELDKFLSEAGRISKKGSYIFITVPAEEILKENECFCPHCLKKFHRWGHKQSWDRKKIEAVFGDFEIVKIKDFFCAL